MGRAGIIVSGLVAIALVIGVVVISGNNENSKQNTTGITPASASNEQNSNQPDQTAASITYNGSLFSPSQVTVNSGDLITLKNNSSVDVDFASGEHPTHQENPELNIGVMAPRESRTFKVTAKGSWSYHNHFDPTQSGTIVVK